MDLVELSMEEYQRLMDAILWVLGPYLDENGISEHPHLLELGECYNELYRKMPKMQEHNYPELIFF
ncbi:MAG: hypothetical protein PHP53_05685 [Prolixibacteraceae bacterium]|nr:hypothetical protein [Prolixibacteraceae bacterium]